MPNIVDYKVNDRYLTHREANHYDRGHYHFDPKNQNSDIKWYRHRFPKEACDALVTAVLTGHAARQRSYDDPDYRLMSVGGFSNLQYGYEKTPYDANAEEKRIDRHESIDNWVGTGVDMYKSWGVTLEARRDPKVYDLLMSYIKKYNWMGGDKEDFEYKFWIQYPGQMTMCHMDHMYDFYEGRTRWDDPKVQRKIHCLLSEYEPGNLLCWGNDIIAEWQQGSGFLWDWGLPHWTTNLGSRPRVSLVFSVKGDISDDEIKNGMGENL